MRAGTKRPATNQSSMISIVSCTKISKYDSPDNLASLHKEDKGKGGEDSKSQAEPNYESSTSNSSKISCEGIFPEVMIKYSQEQLKLLRCFSCISEESQYTMKFIGDVPTFYTQMYIGNGVLRTQKGTNSHQYNICNEFFLLSSVKPLRNISMKHSAMFQKMV